MIYYKRYWILMVNSSNDEQPIQWRFNYDNVKNVSRFFKTILTI